MEIIIIFAFILFGLINAFIASSKGYTPWLWFIAGGSILALVVLLIFPSVKKVKESNLAEYKTYCQNANIAGAIFAVVAILALLGNLVP
jgi:amino acid transporter